MSANLDLVRSIFAAWERGDFSSVEWSHPEIEYVFHGGPEPGRWAGVAEMAAAWFHTLEAWEDYSGEADDFIELEDKRVLLLTHIQARGKSSGIDIGQLGGSRGALLFQLHERKVAKLDVYWERDRALAELGLEAQANVEIVERSWRAFNRGDFQTVLDLQTEDVDYRPPSSLVEGGSFVGHARYEEWLESFQESWVDWRGEPRVLACVGEHVVAAIDLSLKGRESGVEVNQRIYQVYTLREGKFARNVTYPSEHEALSDTRAGE